MEVNNNWIFYPLDLALEQLIFLPYLKEDRKENGIPLMSKQEKNRLHQKKTSYKTIMQKTFLVFILESLGYHFTYLKQRKSKNIKDYKIEYLKDKENQLLIDYYTIINHIELEMKREKDDIKLEEIKKNTNFKIILLMIDYLDSLGFDIKHSPYKKTDYSLSSNYRIHHVSIPDSYVDLIYSCLCKYLDDSNPLHHQLLHSFSSIHSFPEDSVDFIGEVVLLKDFKISLL